MENGFPFCPAFISNSPLSRDKNASSTTCPGLQRDFENENWVSLLPCFHFKFATRSRKECIKHRVLQGCSTILKIKIRFPFCPAFISNSQLGRGKNASSTACLGLQRDFENGTWVALLFQIHFKFATRSRQKCIKLSIPRAAARL